MEKEWQLFGQFDSNLRIWTKSLYLRSANVCDILVHWVVMSEGENKDMSGKQGRGWRQRGEGKGKE